MKTLGERCVDLCVAEMNAGVQANPYGMPNTGERVREYLAGCVRNVDDDPELENLGLTVGNWCCAFQSWVLFQCIRKGEEPPHLYRAAVVEAVEDADTLGRYRRVEEVRAGEWAPKRGDEVVWDRSDPNDPSTEWWRHINRVVAYDARDPANTNDDVFLTIGGNEQRRIMLTTDRPKNLSSKKLLGFIDNAQEPPKPKHPLTERERQHLRNLRALALETILRDNVLAY